MDTFGCELRHLGGCGGGLEQAHIINKSRMRNVAKALKYCDDHFEVLIGVVCHSHNTGRTHDSKGNRAFLLLKRCDLFGYDYVDEVVNGLLALFKVPPSDLRLAALLAVGEEEK
jgi:hypothetical protein